MTDIGDILDAFREGGKPWRMMLNAQQLKPQREKAGLVEELVEVHLVLAFMFAERVGATHGMKQLLSRLLERDASYPRKPIRFAFECLGERSFVREMERLVDEPGFEKLAYWADGVQGKVRFRRIAEQKLLAAESELNNDDAAVRVNAARTLSCAGLSERADIRKELLTTPATTTFLLECLGAADATVRAQAALALGEVSSRYDGGTERIYDELYRLFAVAREDDVKLAVAKAVSHLGTTESWAIVKGALGCLPRWRASWFVGRAVGRYGETIPSAEQEGWAELLVERILDERNVDAVRVLFWGLETLACEFVVERLDAVPLAVDGDEVKHAVRRVIGASRRKATTAS